ncbi:hypothetical protein [Kitasatospora sp. NPDC057198]|uniref:hypothetical protein n=1 Tax=Kitasatospora sp. NPDC057198 TaxID=3346046 RepID=UPI00363E031F
MNRPLRRPARPRHLRLAATVAATAVVAVGTTAAALADPAPGATTTVAPRWEYRWAVAQPGGRTVGDLEQLGKEGWEVVGPVNEYTADRWNFLLKRQLPES